MKTVRRMMKIGKLIIKFLRPFTRESGRNKLAYVAQMNVDNEK
jgi:hypothetical protein